MKRNKRYLLWTVLVIVIAVAVYAYTEYNRKPADLSTVDPQASLTADSLVASYDQDENKTNARYLGKPIEVTGKIDEVSNKQDTALTLFLASNDEMHRVSCMMTPGEFDKVKRYTKGDLITVRGMCTGYLLDVELNRCVVIK